MSKLNKVNKVDKTLKVKKEKKQPVKVVKAVKGALEPVEKAEKKPLCPLDAVISKYTENNWQIIRAPKNGMNDLIAQKANKLHFIQVVTKENIDEPKYHGLAKSSFIQNAFSNNATPVFAHVVTGKSGIKVSFEDVNLCSRVIIGGGKTKNKVEVS
ncbi:Hypothetical protein PACV_159 [Pacmanvirus A23]|uniref:Hypothetical protein n=1 Tax=Pacmanvirus A23 TaxID=1932881 RepID=UPI000A0956D1|nr:Hypothetical protein B9W72_gp157 [Pacmanvirus A23]SIP85874.1 Hypothetical protein PACV_159 [Pacmanvirus A23]